MALLLCRNDVALPCSRQANVHRPSSCAAIKPSMFSDNNRVTVRNMATPHAASTTLRPTPLLLHYSGGIAGGYDPHTPPSKCGSVVLLPGVHTVLRRVRQVGLRLALQGCQLVRPLRLRRFGTAGRDQKRPT